MILVQKVLTYILAGGTLKLQGGSIILLCTKLCTKKSHVLSMRFMRAI